MEAVVNEARKRLEIALAPQKPPTLEEVLAEIGRRGVLSGSLDRVVEGYKNYVSYVTGKVLEVFKLSDREVSALQSFSHDIITILEKVRQESGQKLNVIKREIDKGYIPNSVKVVEYKGHVSFYVYLRRHSAYSHFPDLLKVSRDELEMFQIGWRASDETAIGNLAAMGTTQPWQVFAWLAARPGEVKLEVGTLILTRRGPSLMFFLTSLDWEQKWDKSVAIKHAVKYIQQGEYRPLLTWWLGDGSVKWSFVEKRRYKLRIAVGDEIKRALLSEIASYAERDQRYVYIKGGKALFKSLIEAAGRYGELLEILGPHKWLYLKTVYKPRKKRRKPTYAGGRRIKGLIDPIPGVVMNLLIVFNEGGALWATKYLPTREEAENLATALRAYGLEPRVVKQGPGFTVYLPTSELRKIASEKVRRAIIQFLEEKLKHATSQRHKTIIERLIKKFN
ncbi:hypothetical protein [Pyrobaculum aerophilum]|uniref:Uncharacterized protein n=1 Tax=Pyrobaculum aerophilum TaxID=13773 RepID=A0A371QZ52_9CREN|nr:hypothetical protein [Pyrobaculum aerophilum]RFA96047.1 hypothetical protein CGL52_11795 [Pyrobaculum aerophilum]RFA98301.1 hypothetical protein CGL51_01080 [Pyrobaculum aerophilum]